MTMTHYNTAIIGAGPSGCATSYYAKLAGIHHIVVDKSDKAGSSWEERWENFELGMPVAELNLPGADFSKYPANYRLKKDEILKELNKYVVKHQLPIAFNSEILPIKKTGNGRFLIEIVHTKTRHRSAFTADNVVICIGPRQRFKFPAVAAKLPKDLYMHSAEYKHARDLPKTNANILVIGSGLTALTIAPDIHKNTNNTVGVMIACGKTDAQVISDNSHLHGKQTLFLQQLLPSQLVKDGVKFG